MKRGLLRIDPMTVLLIVLVTIYWYDHHMALGS